MYRYSLLLAALCVACAPVATGNAYYGFSIGVTHAPPPRVVFVDEPAVVVVPGTSVYVVEDSSYDVFLVSGYWYLYSGTYWYRARTSSGPYVAIDVRSVPRSVLHVPPGRWKHHPHKRHPHGGPPGRIRS